MADPPAPEDLVSPGREPPRQGRDAVPPDAPAVTATTRLPAESGPFAQVASMCEAFTQARGGQSIERLLAQAGEAARPALLRNLLVLEVERRRAAGERPRLEEYLGRFPDSDALVREVFLELSPASFPVTRTAVEPKVAAWKRLSVSRLGDYRLLGELGRGGMGVVYEAVHVHRGDRVALKTLPALDGAALHRFKREFRALADVNHPNLVGLHTLEADGGQWFFTMDLVEGTDFLSHVRPGGALDEARLRAALSQLAAAVMALHARRAVHCDLKPSNVMVTRDGRVVVLDFGLVAELGRADETPGPERVVGTPRYMAPEQAAGGPVTPACDWYAVGVMLYEALCGRAPFTGTVLQVLQDKQALDAPPLPADAAAPADLAALAMRLLARDPRERPDPLQIAAAVAPDVAAAPPAVAPSGGSLVGRAPHLAALRDSLRTLERERRPLTVFITGRSGEGKTTLAEHFLAPLRKDPAWAVMSGRCYDRESVPFKALDALIDALAGYLRRLPESDAALLVPDDIGLLAQVFPVLRRVGAVGRASARGPAGLDDQQVRQRAFGALRELLTRVGRRALVLWFVDDLQWGDADSAAALFEVLRPPDAPAVLFLGGYRSDETEGSAFLKAWKELQRKHGVAFADREVAVGPLTTEQCAELVVGLLGADGERVRRRAAEFARETRGNPFLLTELVGCFDPETDSFEPRPLREVLAQKLTRLPAAAAPLLEVVAVSGQALSLEEASRAAGHETPPTGAVTKMRNERLVRLVGPEESPLIDTYHDRVRETVLGHMEAGRRGALHLTLAGVIEREAGGLSDEEVAALAGGEKGGRQGSAVPRAYDLAYHFDAAGERRKALAYALLAAGQARRQFSLGVAVEQYLIALRNAGEAPAAVRYRIALGSAEALMLLGRYDEATARLDEAAALTGDPVELATVEGYQAEIALKLGRARKSIALGEKALGRLGCRPPRSGPGWVAGLLGQAVVHGLHRLFPKRLHVEAPTGRDELTSRLLIRLGYAYYLQNSVKSVWAILRAMNYSERFPPSLPLAFAYTGYGLAVAGYRGFSRGLKYLDRSLEVRRGFNDLWGVAQSLFSYGILLYNHARFEESLPKLDESLELYRRAGDQWEINSNRLHWGLCHQQLGNVARVVEVAREKFAEGVRLGDDNSCHFALAGWASVTRGNFPFDELRGMFPLLADDNVLATSMVLIGEGYWHWFHSRTGEALEAFDGVYRTVTRNLALNHLTAVVLPNLATALRRHADALGPTAPHEARRLRRRAFRTARWATRLTRFMPPYHPQSLRELGHGYAARGRLREALRLAEESCAVALRQKAKYEYAESLLLRGRIALRLGLPGAEEQIRGAEAELAERDRLIEEAIRRPAPPPGRDGQ